MSLTILNLAVHSGPQIRVCYWKLFFLFLNQNICCGFSKEPSRWDGSFEHPKHMFKLMDQKIITNFTLKSLLNWPYGALFNYIHFWKVKWNLYNHIPHLTQDTIWESDKNLRKFHIQDSQEVSPFPAGDHKAARNRQDSMTDMKHK